MATCRGAHASPPHVLAQPWDAEAPDTRRERRGITSAMALAVGLSSPPAEAALLLAAADSASMAARVKKGLVVGSAPLGGGVFGVVVGCKGARRRRPGREESRQCWLTSCVDGIVAGGTMEITSTNSINAVLSSIPICAASGAHAAQPPRRPSRSTCTNCCTATWMPTSGCRSVGT